MQHTVGKLTRHAGRTELTLFEADVGHAFNFQECIRASASVARAVADFEVVKVLARAAATMASSFEKSRGASGDFYMPRHETPKRTVDAPRAAMAAHSLSRKSAS